ncbi:hypothetical protein ACJZ2D_016846 [Fusarium nematophilum]
MSNSGLLKPVKIGTVTLGHRIGMCPLTRFRASDDHVPSSAAKEYYAQRAAVPGTLLISEGTFIAPEHGGYPNVPGIYNAKQIDAWRGITDAVHANGSFIFCQLWALGRAAHPEFAKLKNIEFKSSSNVPLDAEHPNPTPLTADEIKTTARQYAQAAKNAIKAGFDGVELHGANGYLIDQFLQDCCNKRTDDYGGTVENRSRFAFEMVQAVCDAVGAERTGIRLSPWSTYNAMKMEDPVPQFTNILRKLNPLKLAYVHLIESRVSGVLDTDSTETLSFAYDTWKGPLLVAGGYTPEKARQLIDQEHPDRDVVGFTRVKRFTPDAAYFHDQLETSLLDGRSRK